MMTAKKYNFGLSRRRLAHLGTLTGLTTMIYFAAPLLTGVGQSPWFVTLLLTATMASGAVLVAGAVLLFKNRSGVVFTVGCLGSASPWIWAVVEFLVRSEGQATMPLLFLAPVVLYATMLACLWGTRT